jgi:hypothetical protein
MIGVPALWRHQFRLATWSLLLGAGLTFIFFRHRKIAFAIIVLSFFLGTAGPIALVHPTGAGIAITLVSAFLALVLVLSVARKYPNLRRKGPRDWSLFDRDPE